MLGTEVNGIWEKYTDTNDVNATDACFAHEVVVSGDDFGLVKLFRFPCVRKGVCSVTCLCAVMTFETLLVKDLSSDLASAPYRYPQHGFLRPT